MLCLHAHNTTCTHASCASDERRDGAIGRTTGARCGDIGRYRCAMIYDLQADDRGAAAAPLRRRLQDGMRHAPASRELGREVDRPPGGPPGRPGRRSRSTPPP
eukprot:scaffold24754_cov135-Isochrysis_galbana.AAC.3